MSDRTEHYVRAAKLVDIQAAGCLVVHVEGHTLVLIREGEKIYAVDNRCPHMGFPLHRGTVKEGILTCHWHHARFDLASGGTFDPWADDVRSFPVQVRNGEVWVDLTLRVDPRTHQRQRLRDGLERNISLVIAKAVISLLEGGDAPVESFRIGLDFGVRYRQAGWGQGLTIHTSMMNLLPYLASEDRPRALYHGLSAVARDCSDMPPRFPVHPLPTSTADVATIKRWFRQFIEVRDAEGAERCIVSAVRSGIDHGQIADLLFTAATDHRYIDIGHVLDFTNKALEALDLAGWEHAERVLTSLIPDYANAARMEESNAWRYPVDLVSILKRAFEELPSVLQQGRDRRGTWTGADTLVPVLLGEDPQAIAEGLLDALSAGATEQDLGRVVAYAAVMRIAHFHTSNEFGDWDTALHTFTFANAVHQGLQRVPSAMGQEGAPLLLRGVFDAAMSNYLNRFLNVPAAPLPAPEGAGAKPEMILAELSELLDRQQQVDASGEVVTRYLDSGSDPDQLLAVMGRLLLREDRDFHTIQVVEAAFRQYTGLKARPAGTRVLVAAARYLAAHAPTVRAQGQTYQVAQRLYRGERLFEEA
ncbi:MAG: Rieske (2Fe-2S) protein [Candidatus Methylomirabilales bacterium]